ncbi:DUF3251 domain-containing protein [Acerihabitans arboris]|uniref:DUF3251 domain-containing protein n=1 Tax=Acerihabitans arboris TaxID=2691583 RepID=A0A845SJ85_9GAMM|nr:DUF3251 domain-containing protein [Acerihabitans arboris]NDL64980.1 DUF3251 domain-containing protein [Acerihabitans arboris]
MTTSYRSLYAGASLLLLAGCAHQSNPKIPELKSEIVQLNQRLQYLNDEASALMQQNALNEQSADGVYIYPAAQTGAQIDSGIGMLLVSLGTVEAEANGSRALLHIRTADRSTLPAFHAVVDWGQVDPASGKPLTADTLSQPIVVPASLLPKPEATIELRLSGLAPEQVGYIRLRDIIRNAPETPPAPDAVKPLSRQ